MELYLLNDKLEKIDILDCNSMIWNKKYCDKGECEATFRPSPKLFEEMKDGCFLLNMEKAAVMIIENIQLQTNEETGDLLIIKGSSAEGLLSRRIVWEQTMIDANVCEAALQLVRENLVSPKKTERKIDIVEIGKSVSCSINLQKQIMGGNLLQEVMGILATYNLGFEMKYTDTDNNRKFLFKITKGTNRAKGNAEGKPAIIFTEKNDNLLNSDYSLKYEEYKNVCLVAGEGEGEARKQKEVGHSEGLYRREVYLDNGSLSTNDGSIGPEQYEILMDEAGKEHLASLQTTKEFSGEIIQIQGYRYGIDFCLGDIVTVINKYGIAANVRIIGIVENWDENGYNAILNFENI